jgi:hypothetical protein
LREWAGADEEDGSGEIARPMHSTRLTHDQIRGYLVRSYTAVDGLWFMKVEEQFGFDKALEIDQLVWEVMPKIQARQLQSFLGVDSGLDALQACYSEKLSLDGFKFQILSVPPSQSQVELGTERDTSLVIHITFCPWYEKLVRSNRAHLAASIGKRICATEYSTWAHEFGCRFEFGKEGKLCEGGRVCVLKFCEP